MFPTNFTGVCLVSMIEYKAYNMVINIIGRIYQHGGIWIFGKLSISNMTTTTNINIYISNNASHTDGHPEMELKTRQIHRK